MTRLYAAKWRLDNTKLKTVGHLRDVVDAVNVMSNSRSGKRLAHKNKVYVATGIKDSTVRRYGGRGS